MSLLLNFKFLSGLMFWAAAAELIGRQFELIGNSSHFETFDKSYFHLLQAPHGVQCKLTEFKLKYAQIDREFLLNFLGECRNLVTLELHNIRWHWNKPLSGKIYLPKLKVFNFTNNEKPWSTADDLESIIFFYVNSSLPSAGLVQLTSVRDFSVEVNFANEGILDFNQREIEGKNIKDQNVWRLLQGILSRMESFTAWNSILDVTLLDMKLMKTIELHENELVNGKVADILKSSKVAETLIIYSSADEAIDISILPTQTLNKLVTVKLSFRWSSTLRPEFFPKLKHLCTALGDIDLNLFKTDGVISHLYLGQMRLWTSTLDDIGMKMPNLNSFDVHCHFIDTCPLVLLDLLPKQLEKLSTSDVDFRLNSLDIRFEKLNTFQALDCNYPEILLDNFWKIFPELKHFDLGIRDFLKPGLFTRIYNNMTSLRVFVPFDTKLWEWSFFVERVKVFVNMSDMPYPIEATNINFRRVNGGWEYTYEESGYAPNKFTRLAVLGKRFGISMEGITKQTLATFYYSYSSIVYVTCAVGIFCNSLSVAVFMRKSMRSSSSCLLLGLALCDTLYLLTALVPVEEFQLLFTTKPQRSSLNGHFAYPLNKTAYTGSVYMTILITIGRFVAICFPLRIASTFSIEKTIRYILGVFLMAVLLNFPRWFEFIKWDYEASSPVWSWYFERQLHRYPIYQIVFQKGIWYLTIYVLPFVSISILNLFIAIQARKAAIRRRVIAANTTSQTSENKLTKVLLTIVFVFFLCNALSASINWVFISKGIEPEVADIFACLPIIVNSSVNFLLYYLMGTQFRKEFKLMLNSLQNRKCKKSSIHNTRQRGRQAMVMETRL